MTHIWAPELEAEFETLLKMQRANTDVWLLLDSRTQSASAIAARYPLNHQYDEARLFKLPYPRLAGHGLIDHPHFPVLDFFNAHPEYDRYWIIEYDVRFTGEWHQFFDSFEDYPEDVITSHIRRFPSEPYFCWWETLHHPSKEIPLDKLLRSFNVIYRLSHAALAFLHASQLDGWEGYPEVSIATLLSEGGFRLLDMGGDGEFVPHELRNRSYTSSTTMSGRFSPLSTMRYRPARVRPGRLANKIYHPVKPADRVESTAVKMQMAAKWIYETINDVQAVKAVRRRAGRLKRALRRLRSRPAGG